MPSWIWLQVSPPPASISASPCFTESNLTFTLEFGHIVALRPGVHIYTIYHPVDPMERIATYLDKPLYNINRGIKIGSDGIICGGSTILPGVTIGDHATIATGSVVNRGVPSCSVVAGGPAKVNRT